MRRDSLRTSVALTGSIDFDRPAPYQTTASMERKTLDQRAQMTDLERLRHSAGQRD
jgi:hypothetical protein